MKKLISLIYPFTKAKLRRALNFAGMLIAAASVVVVWASKLDVGTSAGATIVLITTALANWQQAIVKLEAGVESLPIPADDEPTKPLGPPAAAAIVLLGSLLLAGQARADNQFGGCIRGGSICFGPSATVTVGQFNFATSKFSGGIVPGVGYGATYMQSEWYATGLAGYLAFTVGKGEPNQAIPSLMLSFANYLRLGAGVSITEGICPPGTKDCPVETQWRLLFGVGSDIGGSPKYVSSQKKQ